MPNTKRKPILPMTQERIDTFWSRVAKGAEDTCWNWIAGKDSLGYGVFQAKSTKGWNEPFKRGLRCVRSHRIAFALSYGYESKGHVCHHCDNKSCCNPKHLYDGTYETNSRDAWVRGIAVVPVLKLTNEQVLEIRALYPSPNGPRPRGPHRKKIGAPDTASIAVKYGVSKSTILRIANRQGWKHIK